jgi:hypothetical protein
VYVCVCAMTPMNRWPCTYCCSYSSADERERTQCAQLLPLFRRLILFLSFFFLLHTLSLSSFMYVHVCVHHKTTMSSQKKKKMSCLHICKPIRARTLHLRRRQKSNYNSLRRKKKSYFLFLPVYMYMYIYVQWCDSYIDAVPSATICFWTNQRFALFLSFFFLHMYIYIEYVQKETRLILLQSMTGQNWYYHIIFAFMHKFFFLSPPLFFFTKFSLWWQWPKTSRSFICSFSSSGWPSTRQH